MTHDVTLLLRRDADCRSGGDVLQAREVARHLRSLGARVREHQGWEPDLRQCDVALVMNLTVAEQAWLQARACRSAGVPYVLLPVFWDLATAIPVGHAPTASRLLPVGSRRREAVQRLRLSRQSPRALVRTAGNRLPWYFTARTRQLVQDVVAGALAVCPNSEAELAHLADYCGFSPTAQWVVVRNGVRVDELPPLHALAERDRDDIVLCVGGVSPRKNSLGLMRAARQVDCDVVVIGAAPHRHDAYGAEVLAAAPPNVRFAGQLPRAQVLKMLAACRVHVQPGFVETPGLASLEAAALGTAIVVSDTPPVREYFGKGAGYADPHDVGSLVQAIEQARQRPVDVGYAGWIRDRYDWPGVLAPLADIVLRGPSGVRPVDVDGFG